MTHRRRSTATVALLATVAVLVTLVGLAPTAQATSYRYWNYWLGGAGDWTFASQGPARRPPDGSVEGWRFAISEAAGSSDTPRVTSSFAAVCGDTDPVAGKKRVGLVLDFGASADAPPGESPPNGPVARCLVLPETATGYDVLVAASSIRVDDGLVCGIAGYPRTGCGEPVLAPQPSEQPTKPDDRPEPPTDGQQQNNDNQAGGDGSNTSGGNEPGSPSTAPTDTSGSTDLNKPASERDAKQDRDQRNPDRTTKPQAPAAAADEEPVDVAVALDTALTPTPDAGSPWGVLVGLLVILGLAGATGVMVRRRR